MPADYNHPLNNIALYLNQNAMDCPQINKNSKLYQKFLEKKGQGDARAFSSLNKSLESNRTRCDSYFKQSNVQKDNISTPAVNPFQAFGDENIDTSNIMPNQPSLKREDNINDILKKQLERNRKSGIVMEKSNNFENSSRNNIQINLERDYLATQNQKLREKLTLQQQKVLSLQECLNQEIRKSKKMEEQIHKLQIQLRNAKLDIKHDESDRKNQETMKQVEKIKEQNYLAKDYLYKLTLKLYQSEQQNQRLKKQIAFARNQTLVNAYMPQNSQITAQKTKHHQFSSATQQISQPSQKLASNPQLEMPKSKHARIEQIERQLQEINALKVFNGKNRRKKIELERQLEQLKFS